MGLHSADYDSLVIAVLYSTIYRTVVHGLLVWGYPFLTLPFPHTASRITPYTHFLLPTLTPQVSLILPCSIISADCPISIRLLLPPPPTALHTYQLNAYTTGCTRARDATVRHSPLLCTQWHTARRRTRARVKGDSALIAVGPLVLFSISHIRPLFCLLVEYRRYTLLFVAARCRSVTPLHMTRFTCAVRCAWKYTGMRAPTCL